MRHALLLPCVLLERVNSRSSLYNEVIVYPHYTALTRKICWNTGCIDGPVDRLSRWRNQWWSKRVLSPDRKKNGEIWWTDRWHWTHGESSHGAVQSRHDFNWYTPPTTTGYESQSQAQREALIHPNIPTWLSSLLWRRQIRIQFLKWLEKTTKKAQENS